MNLKEIVIIVTVIFFGGVQVNSSASPSFERIITNEEDLENGVPIDFSYNETENIDSDGTRYSSVPGCPKSEVGIPWIYYGSKCYLAGTQGPCKRRTRLFVERGSPFGVCNCDCQFSYFVYNLEDKVILSSKRLHVDLSRHYFCRNNLYLYVFHKELKQCFSIAYEQGPCDVNHWLELNYEEGNLSTATVTCEPRKCPDDHQLDWHKIKSDPDDFCNGGKVESATYGMQENSCPTGTVRSPLMKQCVRGSSKPGIGK